ncbi:GntR family transcriptional regulator [Larkinella rosea]|uniref:GntR family transcriptional regulator n=1 Tax=Larkinella rosea TaxID=2025312 RepID=A0A3P1BFW8_9BACT|nr:GntR family transcriptional regulator [Larkinella rosea]RRA99970.1 GntR family transcriptional regulator [Larkinella rosea]
MEDISLAWPTITKDGIPKYQQLIDSVLAAIEKGTLGHGQQLPSISELADKQGVGKVTVAKAYEELRQRGVIRSQHGKGFYVASTDVRTSLNVLVIFDTLNAFKEMLYEALKAALPADAALSIFFHHYNPQVFESLIRNGLGRYNAYVIMPHFEADVSDIVSQIPRDKLLLIDQAMPDLTGDYAAVYQDFEKDIYEALKAGLPKLRRYRKVTLVQSKAHFQYIPPGTLAGFRRFGEESGMACVVVDNYHDELIQPGEAYLLYADRDMIQFIKHANRMNWQLGQDVGLISYDETPVKEILAGGITVISTDFAQMGQTAGQLLTERSRVKIANPGRLILRQSL